MTTCALMTVLIALSLGDSRRRALRTLMAFMVAATLLYAGHYIFFGRALWLVPFSDTIYVTANLAVYPLYLIYIRELTASRDVRYLLLLLPALIGGTATGTLYALMTPEQTQQFVSGYLYGNATAPLSGLPQLQAMVHSACKVTFAALVVYVAVSGLRLIRRYNRLVNEQYADTEGKTLSSIRILLWLVTMTALASFVANAIGRQCFTASPLLLTIPSLLFSTLLFAIGYTGLRCEFSIKDVESEGTLSPTPSTHNDTPSTVNATPSTVNDTPSTINPTPAATLTERIRQYVSDNRIYLQPNLKLNDLARQLGTNRTYINQSINGEMGITFSEFINRQRIQYAEQMARENPQLPISELATMAGFSSLSSFYRNLQQFRSPQSPLSERRRANARQ